jgi:hypothetical protein
MVIVFPAHNLDGITFCYLGSFAQIMATFFVFSCCRLSFDIFRLNIILTAGGFATTLACMQTLGLSGESRRTDGRLKSIFWPAVENAWDVDYIGQQGFWICAAVGIFQLVGGALSANPFIFFTSAAVCLVFLIGAMGVREASWPAAAAVFALYSAGLLNALVVGQFPAILSIVAAALLLSNVRAAFLASCWSPAGPDEDKPMRFNKSLRDKLVDQRPPKLWPVLQAPFFALAAILLLFSLFGIGMLAWNRINGAGILKRP